MAVIGVVASTNPKKSVITVRVDNRIRTLRIGQFFGNNYRIKDLKGRYVVIEDSNKNVSRLLIGDNSTITDIKVINQEIYDDLVEIEYDQDYVYPYRPVRYDYRYINELTPYYLDDQGPFGFTLTGNLFNTIGLQQNDVLLEYNGKELSSYINIYDMMRNLGDNEEVNLNYLRNGRHRYLRLLLK